MRSKEDRIKEYKEVLVDAKDIKDWSRVEYIIDQLDWELKTHNGLLKE